MNIDSLKARLRNIAVENGRTFQDVLVMYGLERTIYRLSISKYKDKFTLKGGIFLYGLTGGNFERVTTDIDLLGQNISNDLNNLKIIFKDIFSIPCDDGILFAVNTLKLKTITEFKHYSGANVSITGYLDKTRLPVSIDIGFGDVVYPSTTLIEFPALLDNQNPAIINAYSLESCIAEKFEAIVSLGYANSRFKDFYDLYILSGKYDFNGSKLQSALIETFDHRKTSFKIIDAFNEGFSNNPVIQSRWKSFTKKKKIHINVSLKETIEKIYDFLEPVVTSIEKQTPFNETWYHEKRKWVPNHM